MNILFAGSPKSSSEILDFLAKDPSLKIKGVLTQPDKKGKRGTKLYESEVARIAREHNLNIFKPKTLDCPSFVDEIKNLDIDVQLIEKINSFAPIKHILKNKPDNEHEIIELLDDVSRDLNNYDLEFRIQELESKFSKDLSEATFNELKELKKKQNIN